MVLRPGRASNSRGSIPKHCNFIFFFVKDAMLFIPGQGHHFSFPFLCLNLSAVHVTALMLNALQVRPQQNRLYLMLS